MGMVGRTVQEADADHQLVCLGIASWGATLGHERMEEQANGKVFRYNEHELDASYLSSPRPCRAALEPNHTHFLCVDDGSSGKFGVEIPLRSAVEDAICSLLPGVESGETARNEPGLCTPMVLLVVSGGEGTLRTILATLQKQRPVVVMADSGAAATDIYLHNLTGQLPECDEDGSNTDYVSVCAELLPLIKEHGSARTGANYTEQLTFFHTGSDAEGRDNELDVVLLEAILSDCERTIDAIMYAVRWGEPSIISTQLESSKERDPLGLARALELAVIASSQEHASSEEVVRVLVEANVDTRLIRYDRLFTPAHDRFHLQADYASVGFDLLRRGLAFCGYNSHLEARALLKAPGGSQATPTPNRLSKSRALFKDVREPTALQPNWFDLMLCESSGP